MKGGFAMANKDDIIIIADEQGNEIETVMLDTFFYEEQEYAILADATAFDQAHGHEHGEECGCDHDHEQGEGCGSESCGCDHDHGHALEIFIMKFEEENGEEILVSPDEDKIDVLADLAEQHLQEIMTEEFDGTEE